MTLRMVPFSYAQWPCGLSSIFVYCSVVEGGARWGVVGVVGPVRVGDYIMVNVGGCSAGIGGMSIKITYKVSIGIWGYFVASLVEAVKGICLGGFEVFWWEVDGKDL